MIYHSAVSLDYLEERIEADPSPNWLAEDGGPLSLLEQKEIIQQWRADGRAYAPPCDNVTPDGRCAGHEKEESMTNYTGPTPYDDEIAHWVGPTQHGHTFSHLIALKEGYLRAKAEDAPLLETLVLLVNYIGWTSPQKVEEMTRDWLWDSSPRHLEVARQAWDAIAQAQGRTP